MFLIMLAPVVFGLLLYYGTLFLVAFSSRRAASVCMPGVRPVPWWCSWLLLVPLFSLGWAFVLVLLLSRRMALKIEQHGAPLSLTGRTFGLTFAVSHLGLFVVAGTSLLLFWALADQDGGESLVLLAIFVGGSFCVLALSVLMLVFGIAYASCLLQFDDQLLEAVRPAVGATPPTEPVTHPPSRG